MRTAAVVREPSAPFLVETLELSDPRPDEVGVRIVAAGMCQTDLHGRDGRAACADIDQHVRRDQPGRFRRPCCA